MPKELETQGPRTPIRKKAAASLVLVVASALAIWVAIGIIKAIFVTVVIIAAVVAVLWALKTIVW
jgi:hypothetical protein